MGKSVVRITNHLHASQPRQSGKGGGGNHQPSSCLATVRKSWWWQSLLATHLALHPHLDLAG
eukprot:6949718-Prorocentrum_lima.AAC.1